MKKLSLLDAAREDKWFGAFILGEVLLVTLGLFLPIIAPYPSQGPISLLMAITAFRLFFLWGVATRQKNFHYPYFFGSTLFFLGTLGNLTEIYRSVFGYAGYSMHWGSWLTPFAWLVRGVGVTWYLKRGRYIEAENAMPAAIAMAALGIFIIGLFTPFALFLMTLNRLIYGIFIEGM